MRERLNNKTVLEPRRKKLRRNLTPAEAFLWTVLKNSNLAGRKFRRQHSVGNYILDFYCDSEKLVVELDGEVHRTDRAAKIRTRPQALPERPWHQSDPLRKLSRVSGIGVCPPPNRKQFRMAEH